MGRNKIKIEKIGNERIRQVTYYKRKRGLIKKSMELSLLCEVNVLLCVMDKGEKMMFYATDGETITQMQSYLSNENVQKEYLINADYKELFMESTKQSETETHKSNKATENSGESDNEHYYLGVDKHNFTNLKKKSTFFTSNQVPEDSEKILIKDLTPLRKESEEVLEESEIKTPLLIGKKIPLPVKQDLKSFFDSLKDKLTAFPVKPCFKMIPENSNLNNLNETRPPISGMDNIENFLKINGSRVGAINPNAPSLWPNQPQVGNPLDTLYNQAQQQMFNSCVKNSPYGINNLNNSLINSHLINNSNNNSNPLIQLLINNILNQQQQQNGFYNLQENINNTTTNNYINNLLTQQQQIKSQNDFLLKRQREENFNNNQVKFNMLNNLQQNMSNYNNFVNSNLNNYAFSNNNDVVAQISLSSPGVKNIGDSAVEAGDQEQDEERIIKPPPTPKDSFKSLLDLNLKFYANKKDF